MRIKRDSQGEENLVIYKNNKEYKTESCSSKLIYWENEEITYNK